MSAKPLIFVHPMSETVAKLKEVIEETAEEEGIEIFEIEKVSEYHQLCPTLGQNLTIFSHPKKCAQALQPIRKIVFRHSSKNLLLTKKSIPRKTMQKFEKIGLTESITEPVAPKTLLYKVKLLLRSITVASEEDDEEFNTKTFGKNDSGEESEGEKKIRRSQENEDEGEALDYLNQKKEKRPEIEIEEDDKASKEKYEEESIGGQMRGKLSTSAEEEIEEERKKSEYKEEAIDGQLRGKVTKKEAEIEIEAKKKELSEHEDEEEFDRDELRKSLDVDIIDNLPLEKEAMPKEEQEASIEKKKKSLDVEDESKGPLGGKNETDHIDGHMRGKLSAQKEDEIGPEINQKAELQEEELEDPVEKKKKLDLDVVDEDLYEKEEYIDPEDDFDEDAPKIDLDILEADADDPDREKLEEKQSGNLSGKGEKADHIETHMKGGVAKKALEDEEEDHSNLYDKKKSDQVEADQDFHEKEELTEQEEDDDRAPAAKKKLDIIDGDHSKDEDDSYEEEDDEDYRRNSTDLDIMDGAAARKELENDEEDENEENESAKKKSTSIEIDDQTEKQKLEKEEEESGFNQKKFADGPEIEELGARKKLEQREEEERSGLDREEYKKQVDDNWDLGDRFKNEQQKEEEKDTQDGGSINYEKDDLGEQTIDYAKIRAGLDGITTDRHGKKAKEHVSITDGEKAEKQLPRYLRALEEEGNGEAEEDEAEGSEAQKEQSQVFVPEPKGLDIAIKALNLYYEKETKPQQIMHFLANEISEQHAGMTSFFMLDKKQNKIVEVYNGTNEIPAEEFRPALNSAWQLEIQAKYETWKEVKIPTWSDKTFQENEMEFVYPYYEGIAQMGFAVVQFSHGFKEKDCSKIEVFLEVCRGLYLDDFHETGNRASYSDGQKPKQSETEEKKVGFFAKLFGKKSA